MVVGGPNGILKGARRRKILLVCGEVKATKTPLPLKSRL